MSSITISELRSAGSELFQDSESFLNELTDREMLGIAGRGEVNVIFSIANTNGNNFVSNGKVYSYVKIGC